MAKDGRRKGTRAADEAQAAPVTTVVGGQPRRRIRHTARVPIGIEKVLYLAASNPAFRARLLQDRAAAIGAAKVPLTEVERSTLLGVPKSALETMIARISPERHGQRKFMKTVAAATISLAAGLAGEACIDEGAPTGVRPDVPDPDGISETADADDAADVEIPPDATEGIDAEIPVPDYGEDGIRPDGGPDEG